MSGGKPSASAGESHVCTCSVIQTELIRKGFNGETIYTLQLHFSLSMERPRLEFVILLDKRTSTAGRLIGRTNAINSFREMRPGLRSEGSSQRSGSASLWWRMLDVFSPYLIAHEFILLGWMLFNCLIN